MTNDLTKYTQAVFNAAGLTAKKEAMLALIDVSYAKSTTKEKAIKTVNSLSSTVKLDSFAFNYMASGEGMKVR